MARKPKAPKATQAAQPPVEPEETKNKSDHAPITAENIDPAFVYEITTDSEGTRGLGMVVNFTHHPDTKEWIPDLRQRKRFFVFKPGKEYKAYTMPIDEAVTKRMTQAYRKGPEEQRQLDNWIRENY